MYIYIYTYIYNSIRHTEFERHGLPLPDCCMGEPFKISTH